MVESTAARGAAGGTHGHTAGLPASALYELRRHWLFVTVLALAAGLRIVAWLAVHPAWWILGDGIGYLDDALHLQPDRWRPSGYSLLVLKPLLKLHHLSLVTAVQHLMGMTVGVLVYVTLLRFGLPRWVAALAAVPVLFDGYFLATEQMVASEALFATLIVAAVVVLMWRIGRPPHVAVAATGVLLALSGLTRIVGLPVIAIAMLVLLLPRPSWSRLVTLGVAFALPVGLYALWFAHSYGQVNLTASSGIFLYGRTTEFVDCARVQFSDPRLRQLCPSEPVGQRNEIWYVFDVNSPLAKLGLSDTAGNDLAGRFAADAIRAQPREYASLVWDGVVKSFAWNDTGQPNDMLFQTDEVLPPDAQAAAVAYQGHEAGPYRRPALVSALAAYQGVAHIPATVLLLALLAAAAGLVFGRDPESRGLRAALVLTAGAALVLLLVPAMTTIVAPRYRVPALPEICLAVALSGSLLVNRWRAGATHSESARPTAVREDIAARAS
jgi:hypothetical protein